MVYEWNEEETHAINRALFALQGYRVRPVERFPMPGPARKSLQAFALWLREERNVSPVTINTYCSAVRRIAKAVPDLNDAEALRVAVEALPLTSVPVVCAAWSAFRAFALALNGTALPEIPRAPRAVNARPHALIDAEPDTLPAEILTLVRMTTGAGWTPDTWAALRWDHAETIATVRGVDHLVFRAPDEKVGVSLPLPEARRLLAWGWGEGTDVAETPPGAPLLPRSPGSMQPFPAWQLRAALRG